MKMKLKYYLVILGAIIIAIASYILYTNTAFFAYYAHKHEVRTIEDINYAGDTNPAHNLDLYLPKDKTNFPVVVFVHGGYWIGQDKDYYQSFTGLYGNIGVVLARYGIGTVVVNYRLNGEAPIDLQLNDVSKSIAWTFNNIKNYGGDATNIFLMGHSAGAHMISLLGTDTHYLAQRGISADAIRGYIPMSAIFDLPYMVAHNDEEFNNQYSYRVFGKENAVLKKYSPLTYTHAGMPPFLILTGEHDYQYMIDQTPAFVTKLKSLGINTNYFAIPDNTHAQMMSNFGRSSDEELSHVLEFINTHIK